MSDPVVSILEKMLDSKLLRQSFPLLRPSPSRLDRLLGGRPSCRSHTGRQLLRFLQYNGDRCERRAHQLLFLVRPMLPSEISKEETGQDTGEADRHAEALLAAFLRKKTVTLDNCNKDLAKNPDVVDLVATELLKVTFTLSAIRLTIKTTTYRYLEANSKRRAQLN